MPGNVFRLCFALMFVCSKPLRKTWECHFNNALFLSHVACHSRSCGTFQPGMTAHGQMIDLWGGWGIEINYHIFLSLILSMMRTKKELFTENVQVSTNDYNASFVKRDDLPHHRTSSILIETSARYLICLCGSQIPASQNNSEGNRRWVGMRNSWSLILQHTDAVSVWGWWCVLKKKQNRVLYSTSAQPFEMHMTIAYWKTVVCWEYQASEELKSGFSPKNLEKNFCIIYAKKISMQRLNIFFSYTVGPNYISPFLPFFHIC